MKKKSLRSSAAAPANAPHSKSNDEPLFNSCLVSEIIENDNVAIFTYDDKGNLLTYIHHNGIDKETYIYTSSSIIKKYENTRWSSSNYTQVYLLDAQGKVKSSSYSSHSASYTCCYIYDSDGYLIEEKTVWDDGTETTKYTWNNGNLTEIENNWNGNYMSTTILEYNTESRPVNFVDYYFSYYYVGDLALVKHFGKQSKNLVSRVVGSYSCSISTYTYVFTYIKDSNGNIIKLLTKHNDKDEWILEYKYDCK